MKELLTPGGEHHGIGDGEGLVMTKNEDPPSLEPQTDSGSALPGKNMAWWRLYLMDHDNSFSLIFSRSMWIYSIRGVISGATRWEQPTWARQDRGAHPGGLCPPRGPSLVSLGSRNSYILYKNSSQSFVPFREILFLQKNNTMVVLLKTASVWG